MSDLNSKSSPPIEIDPTEVKALLDQRADFILIDCRRQDEYKICRIEGAILIPMSDAPDRIEELEEHRERLIVVHCHGGIRSLKVTYWLRSQGFSQTQSMSGGIDAWSREIDPSVPRY
jgi:rhodanese-related sulfurtransferase